MNIVKRDLTISLILIVMVLSGCRTKQDKNIVNYRLQSGNSGTAEMIFTEYDHNFGRVSEGEKVGYVFNFENKGTDNLIITNATTTCGCTVPKYETKPIPPGESGTLEVIFNTSGYNGVQTKTVQVKSNALTPVVLLRITAEVVTNSN